MAQLDSKVFQILDNRHSRDGRDLRVDGSTTTLEPGMLVKRTSGSEVGLGGTDFVHGVAYGTPHIQGYVGSITNRIFSAGEVVNVATGHMQVLMSSHLFTSGTLPTAGSPVFAGANGLYNTTGSVKVGRCIRQETVRQPLTVNGTLITVARMELELEP